MRLVSGRLEKRIAAGEYAVVQVRTRKMPKAWLFTEGDLISQMRNRGIGRPSTYSKLVETILKRRYAFEVNGRLISTELGEAVNEYLQKNYAQYVSEETTRELERKMKLIEDGDLKLQIFLSELHEEIRNLP
jgi:reverse gyrase